MSEVKYFHKDRHPRCCCAQCVSDEAEHEIAELEAEVARLEKENELLRMKLGEDMADQWAAWEGKQDG